MAIDTRQKRFSMMNFGEGDQVLFEADGSVDADDRAHLLGFYSGIALSGIVPDDPTLGPGDDSIVGRNLWARRARR